MYDGFKLCRMAIMKSSALGTRWHFINECFNDWGGGGDTTIPSPGRSIIQPLQGIGLRDPLHGQQACPNSTHITRGMVKEVPGRGCFHAVPSPKRGQVCNIPARPQSLNDSNIVCLYPACSSSSAYHEQTGLLELPGGVFCCSTAVLLLIG